MRWAIVSLVIGGLVIGGLSSWAQASRPGWLPNECRRGGGDELESGNRTEVVDDGGGVGMPRTHLGSMPGMCPGSLVASEPEKMPIPEPADWFWFLFWLPSRW
jgi:hypothetical protein